ncbi:TIGR00730 family Rossman fold protein [bacterium]|nr:MAG: TIGR00730 family Rossman fold protein [bacterium]
MVSAAPRRVCVFCGSSSGSRPHFLAAARALGKELAERRVGLVYGGASVGLMGAIADAALENGGEVVGVIPQVLVDKEVAHRGLTQLHVVSSMHDRKALMAQLSFGFVAMPGGIGTLEELFEVWTWTQLGIHAKPVALLNVAGYYDSLLHFLDNGVIEGFLKPAVRGMLLTAPTAAPLLDQLDRWEPPGTRKWLDLASS